MGVVELSDAQNGATVDVPHGDQIVVRLEENPTTGYRWSVHRSEGGVIGVRDSFTLHPDVQFGSGGIREFWFRADQPGRARLELIRLQPWEGEQSADARFAVDIRVVA